MDNLLNRVHHVYGSIKDGDRIRFIRNKAHPKQKKFLELMREADNIYFLGFGFDRRNLTNVLGLQFPSFDKFSPHIPLNEVYAKQLKYFIRKKIFVTNKDVLSLLEHRVQGLFLFNEKLQFIRNGSRNYIKRDIETRTDKHIYIAEKTVTEALKTDFFFE